MPVIVTHFTNSLKKVDKQHNRLKPGAFLHRDRQEVSVVDIDNELKSVNSDRIIFAIGDLIYTTEPRVKARGDMKTEDILKITYDENNLKNIVLEHCPTPDIPNHYNIKPDLEDLEFADKCSFELSRISRLVIKSPEM